ncbi:MAG TPA: hypothetical protein VGF79_03235 [Bacteroidia bacterium]
MYSLKTPLTLTLLLALYACAPIHYVQVQEFKKTESQNETFNLIHEDSILKVSYDMWGKNNIFNCVIENKSDELVFIDLQLSHNIINGNAYPYYRNQTNAVSVTNGTASINRNVILNQTNTASINSNTNTTMIGQETLLIIPPHSRKTLSSIVEIDLIKDERLKSNEMIDSLSFNRFNSPIQFTHLMYYKIGDLEAKNQKVEIRLYLSAVINQLESMLELPCPDTNCEKNNPSGWYQPLKAPYRWCIPYQE